MIPTVTTERLKLRGWRAEDIEPFSKFMADPDVTRFITGAPLGRLDSWRNMAMTAGHWHLRGYGMWAVERISDGAFVGRVGLHFPETWPGPEVGWSIVKDYWGLGYATESARASMTYAFLTQGLDRVISLIHPDNHPSQAVAVRLGESRGPRHDIVLGGETFETEIWSITRNAWESARHA